MFDKFPILDGGQHLSMKISLFYLLALSIFIFIRLFIETQQNYIKHLFEKSSFSKCYVIQRSRVRLFSNEKSKLFFFIRKRESKFFRIGLSILLFQNKKCTDVQMYIANIAKFSSPRKVRIT